MRTAITGANGFIGRRACQDLAEAGVRVRALVRGAGNCAEQPFCKEVMDVGELGPDTRWERALEDVDTVVHVAGRAHILRESSENPLTEFRRVNVHGTERLASVAARAGVRRLIYLSSIGVNGRVTRERPFVESDPPLPHSDYAASKWEGEQVLRRVASETELEVVILRCPIVYGPEVKANFLRLMKLVHSGLPLPLGSVENRRSLLYVGNLTNVILLCLDHPEAAGETFLLGDGEDVSTPELVRRIAVASGCPARMVPFPVSLIRAAGRLSGKSSVVDSLADSLMVDTGKIRNTLGWKPPYTVDDGLAETAEWFKGGAR